MESLGGPAGLGQKEVSLLDLGGRDDSPPGNPDSVLLRRELNRRGDALDDRRQLISRRRRPHALLGGEEEES